MENYIKEAIEDLEIMYCIIKMPTDTSDLLFSIELADNMEVDRLTEAFHDNNLTVSIQDELIEISAKNFSNQEDLQKLVNCFRLCVSF